MRAGCPCRGSGGIWYVGSGTSALIGGVCAAWVASWCGKRERSERALATSASDASRHRSGGAAPLSVERRRLFEQHSVQRFACRRCTAWQYLPDGPGKEAWPDRLHPSADDVSTFFALAANGTGSSLHRPHFAPWSEHARPARFVDHVLRAEDSPVVGMFPRRELRLAKRIYAVATDGQIKASEAEEYAKRVSNEAIDVISPRDGARAYTMFSGHEDAQVFLASSGGKAIVFDASEIRSQGLRAQGVRGIQLDDDHTLVGAFAIEEPEVVLVTAHGYVKRMLLDEFRPQGRGGAGLQTCKLADDDRVVAMVQTTINDDLLLIATDGQYLRLPIWQIPSMGRPARGDRMVAPPDGHMILDACIVPAGTEA